ncbi:TetR/AcrR family transcriptional regulator [Streptomyces sp. NPDC059853]|uniref:TetR/AcrR family transcriptional regulator n=1 Tax=Streptomyces sp. NPDC059853 TaxID=3346973 RepID=UPI003660AE8E
MTRAISNRRNATRQRLYDAAVTLIAEQGFSATTVEEIAERAGVAKGTVYYNFAGKTELFEEVLRDGVDRLATELRRADEAALERGADAVGRLSAAALAGLVFIERNPALTRLLMAELWRTHRAWHATVVSARQQAVDVVERVLHEGVKDGELDPALDVELTAGALVGMILVGALDWLSFHPGRPLREVHLALSRLLHGRVGAAAD